MIINHLDFSSPGCHSIPDCDKHVASVWPSMSATRLQRYLEHLIAEILGHS